MSEGIIQADFGGFNPRFMGISLKLNSKEEFDTWQTFYILNKKPVDEEHNLLKVVTRSVLEHEYRHYHDFLISPYNSYLLRMRIQALQNGIQALDNIPAIDGNCLPVPISRWLLMDNAQREAQMDDWRAITKPHGDFGWVPVSLPNRSKEALLADVPPVRQYLPNTSNNQAVELFVEAAVRSYMRIGQLSEGFGDRISYPFLYPANFFEIPALCVQAQSIWESQGALSANSFLEYLNDSNLGYATLFQKFCQLATLLGKVHPEDQKEGQFFKNIMKMSVWCLLGNYQLEEKNACPSIRYDRLLTHLLNDYIDFRNQANDVAQTWDYWDKQTNSVSWRVSLAEQLFSNEKVLDSWREMQSKWGGAFCGTIVKVFASFVGAQRRMVKYMVEQPEKLVYPYEYLNSPRDDFPRPYIKVELDGFYVPTSWIEKTRARSLWNRNSIKDNETYSNRFVISLNNQPEDKELLDAVIQFEDLMNWCDLAFTDHTMAWEVYEWTRRKIEDQTKKKVLLIV